MKLDKDSKYYIEHNFSQFILDTNLCNPMSLDLTEDQIVKIFTQVQTLLEPHLKAQNKLRVTLQASFQNEDQSAIIAAVQVKTCYSEEAMMSFNVAINENEITIEVIKIRDRSTIRKTSLLGDNNPLILIVDDDRGTRNIIATWIAKSNPKIRIILACNGNEAIQKFEENIHFDLIFMDINMPERNGIEATEAIRDMEKKHDLPPVRIVAMTAEEIDQEIIHSYGMDDLCKKPLQRNAILKAIEDAQVLKLNQLEQSSIDDSDYDTTSRLSL